jgi:hypothetical protein
MKRWLWVHSIMFYTIHEYGYEEGTAINIDSKQVAVLTLQVGFVRMS